MKEISTFITVFVLSFLIFFRHNAPVRYRSNRERRVRTREFIHSHRTFLTYCFYGLLATALETGLYSLFYYTLEMPNMVSTVLSWVLTVVFAFFTNKIFVYRSRAWKASVLLREIIAFFSCRLSTGVINAVWMLVFVDWLGFSGVVMKLLAALVVGLVNYVVGLFAVFSHKPVLKEENEP